MGRFTHRMVCWVGAVLLLAGCTGDISDPGLEPDGPGPGPGTDPTDPRLEIRAWRLTSDQYNGEVARLFGEGAPEADLPLGASEHGLVNIASTARVDLGNVGEFAESARLVAGYAAAQGATAARCETFGTSACTDTFFGWFLSSAFRRPASAAEAAEYRTLFDSLQSEYDYNYAFEGVIRAVLLSPQFIYRWEVGEGDGIVTLGQYEIASLLAFSITDRAPDDELLADAAAGRLGDPMVRENHARRLMDESAGIWQRFFWEWLGLNTLQSQGNEVGLPGDLVGQMEDEYRTFVTETIVTERGNLRDLLSNSHTWATPELAAHYGATHPGGGVQRIELDPAQRGGILTQAAWLVSHGKLGRANVVRRGMGIFRDAMCNEITAIDIDLEAALLDLVGPDATVGEIVEARGNARTCGQCHSVADPVGLVFESYASDGSWQTVYEADGLPVETAIYLQGMGSFERAPEFSTALADNQPFQQCLTNRFAHFLLGANIGDPNTARWSTEVQAAFAENDGSFEELLVALVRDPAFIERRTSP